MIVENFEKDEDDKKVVDVVIVEVDSLENVEWNNIDLTQY